MNKFQKNIHRVLVAGIMSVTVLCSIVISSCDKTSNIGPELTGDEVSIVVDSSFTISGHSVEAGAALSRTVSQLLGIVEAPNYGFISSEFVTQFMPANVMDTAGVSINDIDSLKLEMLVNTGAFVGDSLAIMGLEVYPLKQQLTVPIYSDFNPEDYYDSSTLLGSMVYNLAKSGQPDSLRNRSYFTLSLSLPKELGHKFYQEYLDNPATYSSPSDFAKFFPGIYVKNSYGSGRITRVGSTTMKLYYTQHAVNSNGNDTIYHKVGSYFAVTPEVITNNDISLSMAPEISQMVNNGESVLLAPTGYDVEMQFPAREILASYGNGTKDGIGVVNSLSFQVPVEEIENKYNITPPNDVLLILKKDKESFFINNKLADNVVSFTSTLTSLGDGYKGYKFPDMRQYLLDLMKKETITDEDLTFVLVPITVSSEIKQDYYGGNTTVVTAIIPYVTEPKMAKILFDKAKINFVYSLQTTKF